MKYLLILTFLLISVEHAVPGEIKTIQEKEIDVHLDLVYGSMGRQNAEKSAFRSFCDEFLAKNREQAALWLHCAYAIGNRQNYVLPQLLFPTCSRPFYAFDNNARQFLERKVLYRACIIQCRQPSRELFCSLFHLPVATHTSFSSTDENILKIVKQHAFWGNAHAAFDVSAYYNITGDLEMGRVWALYSAWLGGCYKAYLDMIRFCDEKGFDTGTQSWIDDGWKSACGFWFSCMLTNLSCNLSSDRFPLFDNWPPLAFRLHLLSVCQDWLRLE